MCKIQCHIFLSWVTLHLVHVWICDWFAEITVNHIDCAEATFHNLSKIVVARRDYANSP